VPACTAATDRERYSQCGPDDTSYGNCRGHRPNSGDEPTDEQPHPLCGQQPGTSQSDRLAANPGGNDRNELGDNKDDIGPEESAQPLQHSCPGNPRAETAENERNPGNDCQTPQ
jgi:hypothetical protein